ncbi:DHA2 family efflux MFS transporter permease subunit [Kitasatospora viridis]|uniref:EmrB/QacA subfamily drug resistance transporter n=1 Tax=Kitasatospora viridis TaxID=281105 RepID=A0A561T649_9ACTN|nr:DHA2 family efflux MFS transporter permease subunit [Kitasatospora viridis]TWF82587.1 EmrB/QacA subfamily drug resistance transporter [Kitasatospora viridis]
MSRLKGHPWAVLVVLSLGLFMTQLDILVISIAVPDLVSGLHTSLGAVVWALNAYVLVMAVLVVVCGRLGDLRGQRRVFVAGVALFTVASLLGGLSRNAPELIAARAVQGLGAALLSPPTLAILVSVFPADRRGSALGIRGAVAGAAAVSAPVLGGLLISALNWRWVFFINVPVGIAVLAGAFLIIPRIEPVRAARLDLLGTLLVAVALTAFTFAVSEGQHYHWNGWVWALLGVAAVFFAAFVRQQRGVQDRQPLVPFALFRDRNFAVMNAASVAVTIGVLGCVLVLSVFFQDVAHFGALKTGLIIAPASAVSMVLSPLAGRLADWMDGRILLIAGFLLTAAGVLWSALVIGPAAPWAAFLAPMVVIGLGNAFMVTPIGALAFHEVTTDMAGAAAGVMSSLQQVGSVVGTAMVGALLQNRLAAAGTPQSAVQTTLALPIAVVVLGALVCLAARPPRAAAGPPATEAAELVEQ